MNLYTASDGLPCNLEPLNGNAYTCALFEHAARLVPFAPAYRRQQLKQLKNPRQPEKLNSLARTCFLIGQRRAVGKSIGETLARLYPHPAYADSVEFVCRALANDLYLSQLRQQPSEEDEELIAVMPYPLQDEHKPIPTNLIQALVAWPDNDRLLDKAICILNRQPALTDLLCRYATAYTKQGKKLHLKPSLLLLGPERSRELVLLSHFETNLTQPKFPLREPILVRRQLINQVFHRLLALQNLTPPCRVELISHLVLYDAWHHSGWTTATAWRAISEAQPWQLGGWLRSARPYSNRVACKLCSYWRLPETVQNLIKVPYRESANGATAIEAILALSISAVSWLQITSNSERNQLNSQLMPWLTCLPNNMTMPDFEKLVTEAAYNSNYMSHLTQSMRP